MDVFASKPEKCQRCRQGKACTMSMFNTAWLCIECKEEEVKHPKYEQAVQADNAAIRSGNYNFRGIGTPHDLK